VSVGDAAMPRGMLRLTPEIEGYEVAGKAGRQCPRGRFR
jgi:hypothetical protein